MAAAPLEMYGYWRSQATFRLRVALNLKSVAYQERPINLDTDEQNSAGFRRINPLGGVPTLMVGPDGHEPLTQSLAILEYLEETYPDPPLLPSDPLGRARVRSLASLAISDMHPLIVPRVRKYLEQHANFTNQQLGEWRTHWFTLTLQGFEARLNRDSRTGVFCHGDTPTIADICLAGVMQTARIFDIRVDGIPTVERIVATCESLEAFEKASPVHQVDYPGQKS